MSKVKNYFILARQAALASVVVCTASAKPPDAAPEPPPRFEITTYFEEHRNDNLREEVINPEINAIIAALSEVKICHFAASDANGEFVITGKIVLRAYGSREMTLNSVDGSHAIIFYGESFLTGPKGESRIIHVPEAYRAEQTILDKCLHASLRL